jgi:hypothetical protein
MLRVCRPSRSVRKVAVSITQQVLGATSPEEREPGRSLLNSTIKYSDSTGSYELEKRLRGSDIKAEFFSY